MSKQLKYIESKQEYKTHEWDYKHSTLSKDTSKQNVKA